MLVFLAAFSMLLALLSANISIIPEIFWNMVLFSFATFLVSLAFCWAVWRRGGMARWAAIVIVMSSALVVGDWSTRILSKLGVI